MTKIWISEIVFNDNTKVQFDKNEIIVFVGPNNAGKSAVLKESSKLLKSKASSKNALKVLKDLTISRSGDKQSFKSFLESSSIIRLSDNPHPFYEGFGYSVYGGAIDIIWDNFQNGMDTATPFFVNILGTEERLNAANPAPSIKFSTQAIQHPIHFLQKYDDLEAKFSEYFRQAFDKDLIVHRNARDDIALKETLVNIQAALQNNFACYRPTTPKGENLLEGYAHKDYFMNWLAAFIDDAKKALQEKNIRKATELWCKHLSDRFPLGEDKDETSNSSAGLGALIQPTTKPYAE